MGDGFLVPVGEQVHLHHRQAPAELENFRLRNQVAALRLAQEIDIQIDGHRQRDRTNCRQHRHIEREVGQHHHGGSGNGPTGPDKSVAIRLAHAAPAEPDLFNAETALRMERLRKFRGEKTLDLLDSHDRRAHISSLPALAHGGQDRIQWRAAFAKGSRKATMNAPTKTPSAEAILLREDAGKIAILTLNRPAARNSLSEALLTALSESFSALAKDRDIRAVILAANGPAFCAGHDLKELTSRRSDGDGGRAYFQYIMTTCSAMMQSIVALPQPVIAAVQGIATAACCQLVATCDLAVASSQAKFATPGVDIGLFCSTPMVALSRNVTRKQAMDMLLTGEPISAEEAQRAGLVNRIVEPGREHAEALA